MSVKVVGYYYVTNVVEAGARVADPDAPGADLANTEGGSAGDCSTV